MQCKTLSIADVPTRKDTPAATRRVGRRAGGGVFGMAWCPLGPLSYLNSRHRRTLELVLQDGPAVSQASTRKVDVKLPGEGDSNSHGARPVHRIITMIKWIRTSRP